MPIRLGQCEGNIGARGLHSRHVLHDHVDVDVGGCYSREDARGLTHPVWNTHDGDLGFASIMDNAGDDRLLHCSSFLWLLHPRTVLSFKKEPPWPSPVL